MPKASRLAKDWALKMDFEKDPISSVILSELV